MPNDTGVLTSSCSIHTETLLLLLLLKTPTGAGVQTAEAEPNPNEFLSSEVAPSTLDSVEP